jgi:hypothetical protein
VGNISFYDTLKLIQGLSVRLPKGFGKFTPAAVCRSTSTPRSPTLDHEGKKVEQVALVANLHKLQIRSILPYGKLR